MSKADDIFWRQFGSILVGLTVFGFVVFFIARSIAGDAHLEQTNNPSAVAARIAPAGSVRVGDPTQTVAAAPVAAVPASAAATTQAAATTALDEGESIYNGACAACHATGVANAPKLDDKAAWKPRVALGLEALVGSVLNGKGAMPPKGGAASLDEAGARAAIKYMLVQVGEELADAPSAPATAVAAAGKVMQQATALAGQAADAASAAAATVGSAAGEVGEMAGKAADSVAAAASQATAVVAAAAGGAAAAGKPGNEVYTMGCVACHATGAANAPKLTDKAAWEPRAATGMAALVQSAVNGKGAMPPKGGLMSLTDADIENAVRYMLEQVGISAGG